MRNFKDYEVWKHAVSLSKLVYYLTASFPATEQYGLSQQMRRATVSISSNIAEGAGRRSEPDFARFLEMALGSSFELESQLYVSIALGYTSESEIHSILEANASIQRQISGLISKLRSLVRS